MELCFASKDMHLVEPTDFFSRQRFVLVGTSHPGNVGAAARAIKTMGFTRLILVQPLQPNLHLDPLAIAMASGADDVLAQVQTVDSFDKALADATLTIALSARVREFGPPSLLPTIAAEQASQALHATETAEVAWVFGNERYGLPNNIVDRCRLLVHIPANPVYSSLNLAQAVQLLAYEARLALTKKEMPLDQVITKKQMHQQANTEQIEAMFTHLEQALIALQFLDPQQPKKLMPRLRRLFGRTQLESEEVNILRGIARAILQKRE